jgi:hypothetical protein
MVRHCQHLDDAEVQHGCGTCWGLKTSPWQNCKSPWSCHGTFVDCALATYLDLIIQRPDGGSQHGLEAQKHASLLLFRFTLSIIIPLLLQASHSLFISIAKLDRVIAMTLFVWLWDSLQGRIER